MLHTIKDVQVFMPVFKAENPAFDSSFVLKSVGNAVVRVVTEDGLDGFGMTFGEPVAEYINTILREEVIGKDPLAYEDIWNDMFRSIRSSGRKGLAMLAISAIDIAIWDLRGKILKLPVYKLLGGSKRNIPAYASVGFLSMPVEEVVEKSLEYINDGYKTLKLKVGYDGGTNIIADVNRVCKVREAIGDNIEIIIDANGIYDASTALRLAHEIKSCSISLFEEPVHADDIKGLRRVRDFSGIPVASGENEYTKYGCRDLLLADAVDVLQSDVTRVGGVTEMVKITSMVQAWNLKLAPHFWPQFSSHILSANPNGLYLEVFPPSSSSTIYNPVTNQPPIVNGMYTIPDEPGFGLNYDLAYLKKYQISI